MGYDANAIAPGRRPLSSMSPTFLFGPDRIAALGAKGGSRIITAVLLGILGYEQGLDSAQVVALSRYHHQYLPDTILEEPGTLSASTRQALAAMGHAIAPDSSILVLTHAVDWDRRSDTLHAGADPRNAVGAGKVVATP
jgi:gamma-glutamyltranspeptidase/glutathione hydrolase